MPRKTNKIQSNTTILLVVEGHTERIYFSEMRLYERIPGITIVPKLAQHSDLYHILRTALKENETGVYDSIWCVFDGDTLTSNEITDEVRDSMKKAVDRGIKLAESFPAFEIWFLLHYEMPKNTYSSQNEVINALLKYISDYSKEQRWLESKRIYSSLKIFQDEAIQRAKQLEAKTKQYENACFSDVYKVIEEVISYKK